MYHAPVRLIYADTTLDASNKKSAIAKARPLRRKGIEVEAYTWYESYGDYVPSPSLTAEIAAIQPTVKEPKKKGSVEAHNVLLALSMQAGLLAKVALKRSLSDEETTELEVAIENCILTLSLDIDQEETPEQDLSELSNSWS